MQLDQSFVTAFCQYVYVMQDLDRLRIEFAFIPLDLPYQGICDCFRLSVRGKLQECQLVECGCGIRTTQIEGVYIDGG